MAGEQKNVLRNKKGGAGGRTRLLDGWVLSFVYSLPHPELFVRNQQGILYWRGELPIFDVRAGPSLALHHHHHHPVKSYLFVKLELELLRPSPFGVPDGH